MRHPGCPHKHFKLDTQTRFETTCKVATFAVSIEHIAFSRDEEAKQMIVVLATPSTEATSLSLTTGGRCDKALITVFIPVQALHKICPGNSRRIPTCDFALHIGPSIKFHPEAKAKSVPDSITQSTLKIAGLTRIRRTPPGCLLSINYPSQAFKIADWCPP